MVSWCHGLGEMKPPPAGGETAVGASTGPARTTTCTEASRPQHHATMPPCRHATSPTLSPHCGASPCAAAAPVAPKGRGVTSTKFDSNIFCEKEVSWCHGGMDSGR